MSSTTLGEYYDKWDAICRDLEVDDEPAVEKEPQQGILPNGKLDMSKVSCGFGEPMTEAEFRSRHKGAKAVPVSTEKVSVK